MLETAKYDDCFVVVEGDKIVINSYNSENLMAAVEHFIASIESADGVLSFSSKNEMIQKAEYGMEEILVGGRSLMGYRIVLAGNAPAVVKSLAAELQQKVISLSGIYMPIVGEAREAVEKEIVFGNTKHLAVDTEALGKYGYTIKTEGDKIVIATNDNDFTFIKVMDRILAAL